MWILLCKKLFEVESESRSVMSNSLGAHVLYSPWCSPGQNTGVGSFSLLQRIFPTQGLNPGLLHYGQILPAGKPRSPTLQADSLPAEPQGKPKILEWVASPFSSRSSRPRNQTRVSCIAGRFFTKWAIRESWYLKLTLDYSQFNYSVLFTQDFALHPLLLAFWSTNFSSVDPQGQEREGERRWEKKELIWSVEQVDKKLWALSFLTL